MENGSQKKGLSKRLQFPLAILFLLSSCILTSCEKEPEPTPAPTRGFVFSSNIQGAHYWVKVPTHKGIQTVSRSQAFNGYTINNGTTGTAEYYFQKNASPCTGIYTITSNGKTIFQINMDTVFTEKSGTFEVQ